MPITVVLAIGLDSVLLEAQQAALRSAGYFVSPAASMCGALELFSEGDFDLVLMGQSIPAESRERLTMMIRALGSRVPMACVAESSSYFDALEAAIGESGPRAVVRNIGDAMANQKKPVARASPVDSERLRRLAG
jgi:DNA-binding NtrC family response regulator